MPIDTNFIINDTLHLARNFHTDSIFILNNFSEPDTVFVAKDFSKNWWMRNQSWLSILTTVLTFVLGYVVANGIEKNKKVKRSKQIQDYALMWIVSNRNLIRKQLNEIWRQANFNDIDARTLVYNTTIITINKITELDKIELSEAFVFNRKTKSKENNLNKMYYDLIYNIEYFLLVSEMSAHKHFEMFMERYLTFTKEASENAVKFYEYTEYFTANHTVLYQQSKSLNLLAVDVQAYHSFASFLLHHNKQYNNKFSPEKRSELTTLWEFYLPPIQAQLININKSLNLRNMEVIKEIDRQFRFVKNLFLSLEATIDVHRGVQYRNFMKMNYSFEILFKTIKDYKQKIGFKNWWEL